MLINHPLSELHYVIGASVEMTGVIFALVSIYCVHVMCFDGQKETDRRIYRYFMICFMLVGLSMFSDAIASIFRSRPGERMHIVLYTFNLINFLCFPFLSHASGVLLLCPLREKLAVRVRLHWNIFAHFFIIGELALALSTPITHLLFYIDETNVYHRGSFFPFYYAILCVVPLTAIAVFILFGKEEMRFSHRQIVFYILFPVLCGLVAVFIYGVPVIQFSLLIDLFIAFTNISHYESKKVVAQHMELENQKSRMLAAQMKPHFLANALIAISAIDGNPPETVDALAHFSHYLRGNLQMITMEECLPITAELSHVMEYVRLQQLRFQNMINIEEDLQDTDFGVPPLAVETLVENAIRHGIRPKGAPGTVTIRTGSDEKEHYVIIQDDGVGFDPDAPIDKPGTHVGLDNVRQRMKSMCGGSMEVESSPGNGTRIILHIPRVKEKKKRRRLIIKRKTV